MPDGFRNRVPVCIAGDCYDPGKGLEELVREMVANVAMGARAVKMKVVALPLRADAERVRTVREAVGPEVQVMVDANCACLACDAIQLARLIEDCDISGLRNRWCQTIWMATGNWLAPPQSPSRPERMNTRGTAAEI